jgi:hypothetical protein
MPKMKLQWYCNDIVMILWWYCNDIVMIWWNDIVPPTLFRKPIGMGFFAFRFYWKVLKFLNSGIIRNQVLLKSYEIPEFRNNLAVFILIILNSGEKNLISLQWGNMRFLKRVHHLWLDFARFCVSCTMIWNLIILEDDDRGTKKLHGFEVTRQVKVKIIPSLPCQLKTKHIQNWYNWFQSGITPLRTSRVFIRPRSLVVRASDRLSEDHRFNPSQGLRSFLLMSKQGDHLIPRCEGIAT